MSRRILFPLLVIAASVLPVNAQIFDASPAGGPVSISAPWRFSLGDDSRWANPDFDDSKWPLLRIDKEWSKQGYVGLSGYAWYRLNVKLPESREPLALGLDRVGSAMEVYADGQLIGVLGRMRPTPDWLNRPPATIDVVRLPQSANGRGVEIALRVWESPRAATSSDAGAAQLPRLGTLRAMQTLYSLSYDQFLMGNLPVFLLGIVALVIGLFSLGLFVMRSHAKEYAWAGFYLLFSVLLNGAQIFRYIRHSVMVPSVFAHQSVKAATMVCWLFFVWGFVRAKPDRLFAAGIVLALLFPLPVVGVMFGLTTVSDSYVVYALLTLALGIMIFVRLVRLAALGNRDAQLFLAPFLLATVMDTVKFVRGALYYSGWIRTGTGLELYRGDRFTITWDELTTFLSFLAIGAVLVLRFTRSAQEEQRLTTEMESAKQIQAQLVPAKLPHLEHFRLEATFRPAAEVGGDFYQVFSRFDGSAVIVMGDVSGKGLTAAMKGVLAIGALRALAAEYLNPGALLTRLNREMAGSQNGGFITCLCALVTREGTVVFANAGHLAPYRDGEEVGCNNGLPLGLIEHAEYSEITVSLAPGETLTFLSDGVVEARNAAGELFGFERTRALSGQSPDAIAGAAQTFGQEDDITVLSLSFAPVSVLHP